MATLYTVLATLQEAISAATTGLISVADDTMGVPLNVEVGIGWPSQRTLQDNVRRKAPATAIVTVFDRGLATDSTRWLPVQLARTVTPATVQAIISAPTLTASTPVIVLFSEAVSAGDAVAIVAQSLRGTPFAQVAIANGSDTLDSMANQLAGLINGDPDLSKIMTAVTGPAMVTLTSLIPTPIALQCNVGNGGSQLTEIGRRHRGLQVVVWTRTEDDRITVSNVIEETIAKMEADFGLTFPDGTMGRLLYAGDHLLNEATLADTYRRDFLVSVDYPITTTDALYAVLAPIIRTTQF